MQFFLDEFPLDVHVPQSLDFSIGNSECLSLKFDDPTIACDWYDRGYTITSFQDIYDFKDLLHVVECVVKAKLRVLFPHKNLANFSLSNYHNFVTEAEHSNYADSVLKRLCVADLSGISNVFIDLISSLIGAPMGFKRTSDGSDHWIILRINPPYSFAYNPPHKDIYEDFDSHGICPQMVNAWIPISGVNELAGLGLAPGSHRLCEDSIIRSKAGSEMNGRKFSVNFIQSWNRSNRLINIVPSYGEMLCFSSHLVHGLGVNRNLDLTRVALEFRLHKQ